MESAVSARSRHARRLFAGIAPSYEWVATVLVVATAYAVGAPPLVTGLAALGAALLSLAQRRPSTPVRALRRRAVAVTGQVSYRDGSTQPIDAPTLIAVPEGALRLLWPAAFLMSAGVLGARWW